MRARRWPALFIALFTLTLTAGPTVAQPAPAADAPSGAAPQASHPVVRWATHSDTTPRPLRALPMLPPRIGELFQVNEEGDLPGRDNGGATTPDTAVQSAPTAAAALSGGTGFEGIGNVDGVLPPDPNADVSPTQIVETVNLSFAVYSRSGAKVYGPANINTLWNGFGGACETSNDGDPVVQYDQLANRWMISQFALPRYPRGPFYQCIAVSQTGDATGSYHRYEFLVSNSKLNDYPKFGVWPDAYYMSINQFSCKFIGCSWAGAGAIAFDRVAMLNGQPAQMVYFDLYNTDPNLGGMLPSDLDGTTLPPSGSPNLFAQMDDNAWGYSPDQLQLWGFHVDWSNPGASTFTRTSTMVVQSFDSDMCGYARNCIAQPGGSNLDALSDRLMYRLAYRNFGDHQTLVVNHTVDANGADRAGIRWYELRNGGSGWGVFQQSTFSPDSASRWVGSAAMNKAGDLAIGYSVSSTSVSPSIRAAGRTSGDPLGTLGSELSLKAGSGYQTHTSGRWGDYTSLMVDPTDDCTFWYTGEYTASVSSASWHTYIGSFTISDCGSPAPTAPTASFTASPTSGTAPLTVQFTDTSTGSPTSWSWDFGDGGMSTAQNPSHQYTAAGDYTVSLTATNDAGSDSATRTGYIHVSTPAAIGLSVTAYKVKGLQKADLSWSGATTTNVDVWRNNAKIVSTPNDGAYTDNIDNRGSGSYTYMVCEAGSTTACSDPVTVNF
jgi:PKD repeat protein